MRIAATADGTPRRARSEPGTEEYRCFVCSRQLVLRSGPVLAPHFAHRPRQSCAATRRAAAGTVPARTPVQLRLFELDALIPPTVEIAEKRRLWLRLARWFRRRRRRQLNRGGG